MPSTNDFRRNNPRRRPDWRWKRAAYLFHNTKKPARFIDDEHIAKAVRFIRTLTICRTEDHLLIVDIDLPHQLAAYQLGCDRHDPFVADLEARILAGQAPEEISRNLAVTPAIVKTYEAWFFNVNDRLEHPSWVTQCVLGSDYHRGRIHQDISLLWKAVAYFGTGESLDELIYGFQGIRHLQTPQEVSDFFRKDCFNQVRLRAAIALRTIDPADQQQALQLLRQWAQQRELELKGKGETDDNSALEQSVSTAFEGISAAFAPARMTAEPRQQTEAVTEPGDPFL